MTNIFLYLYSILASNNFLLTIIFFVLPISVVYNIHTLFHIILFSIYYISHFFFDNIIEYCLDNEKNQNNNIFLNASAYLEVIKNILSIYFLSYYIIQIIQIYNKNILFHYGLISIIIILFLICLIESENTKTTTLINIFKIIFFILIFYVIYCEYNIIYKIIPIEKNLSLLTTYIIPFLIIIFSEKTIQEKLIEPTYSSDMNPMKKKNNILIHVINILIYIIFLIYNQKHTNLFLLKSTSNIPELFLKNYAKKNFILHISNTILIIILIIEIFSILMNTKKLIHRLIYNHTEKNIIPSEIAILFMIFMPLIIMSKLFSFNNIILYIVIGVHYISYIIFIIYYYYFKTSNKI